MQKRQLFRSPDRGNDRNLPAGYGEEEPFLSEYRTNLWGSCKKDRIRDVRRRGRCHSRAYRHRKTADPIQGNRLGIYKAACRSGRCGAHTGYRFRTAPALVHDNGKITKRIGGPAGGGTGAYNAGGSGMQGCGAYLPEKEKQHWKNGGNPSAGKGRTPVRNGWFIRYRPG